MTRMTCTISTAVLILLTNGVAHAQQKPDFNGTWKMDMSRSESAAQGTDVSPRAPVLLVVRQTTGDLNVETDRDGTRERLRYVFGRTDSPAPASTGRTADSTDPAGVEWRGADLVTTTVYRVH